MKKIGSLLVMLIVLCLLVVGCGGKTAEQTNSQPVELTVSAAVSLKDALTEIQNSYQAKHSNVKILYNLGSSGSLQKQIEEGAPADIFISAAAKQMDDLEKKNLIKKETRKNLVDNQLVLIVPKNSTLQLTKFEDLTKSDIKQFAMGAPESVPAGQYTQQVLKKLNLYDTLQPKVVLAKDVRTVLAYVETGNVEAGTVYKTDATISDKVKIVAAAPEGTHDPIVYPIAEIAATKQAKAAEDFIAYLSGPESKAVFEKYGFVMSK
jgi:molybdate transport system substrate-binding protein